MTTPPDPGDGSPVELNIELAVDSGQTKTVHRLKLGGALRFKNGSATMALTIASPAEAPPFILPDCPTAVSSFTVPPAGSRTVTISEAYGDRASFTYTARIEGSLQEDPIVIIERR